MPKAVREFGVSTENEKILLDAGSPVCSMHVAPEYAPFIDKVAELSPDEYYKFVFGHPMEFYRQRVSMIGARGYGSVLDAGHGFGQWSVALAEMNGRVVGIDRNEAMFKSSQVLRDFYKPSNIEFLNMDVAHLSDRFRPPVFDLVWSWATIQFMDRKVAMKAFNSVLKRDGVLILGGVNTPAKWLYKAYLGFQRGIRARSYYKFCWQGFFGARREASPNSISLARAQSIADMYGFSVEAIGYDGELHSPGIASLYFEETPARIFQNIEMRLVKTRDL